MTSRILVVEDDTRLAATLERVLAAEGHEVELVGDGLQAQVPILLLTALGGTDERVRGLDAGLTTTWSSRLPTRSF